MKFNGRNSGSEGWTASCAGGCTASCSAGPIKTSGSKKAARTSFRKYDERSNDPATPGGGRSRRSTSTCRGAPRRRREPSPSSLPLPLTASLQLPYSFANSFSPNSFKKSRTVSALRPTPASKRTVLMARTKRWTFCERRFTNRFCCGVVDAPTRACAGAVSGLPKA